MDQETLEQVVAPYQPAKLIETHVSLVFLCESKVLKFKKPVDLGFVDHRTLQARFKSAYDEVVLNKRLSKDVYLGLLLIEEQTSIEFLEHDKLPSELSPSVVEVAVVMRRIPQECFLSEIISPSQDLPSETKKAIFQKLLSFHQECLKQPQKECRIIQSVLDNYIALNSFTSHFGEVLSWGFSAVEKATRSFIKHSADLISKRVELGAVVDGHGDLRAEHLCIEQGQVQVIDCVEFSQALRQGDVLSDIAFLAMDFDHLGFPLLASELKAFYRQELPEYFAESLWNFYLCYRALVRAKVRAFRLEQVSPEIEIKPIEDEIKSYLNLACRYTLLPKLTKSEKIIFVVFGYIGVGKSTFARALGDLFGFPYLNTDIVRKSNQASASTGAYGEGKYSESSRGHVYDLLFEAAESELNKGYSVIVDGTFSKASYRSDAKALGEKTGAQVLFLRIVLPLEENKARIATRKSEETDSEARLVHLEQSISDFESPCELGEGELQEIDGRLSKTKCLETIFDTASSALSNISHLQT